jgi:hypothetical protein
VGVPKGCLRIERKNIYAKIIPNKEAIGAIKKRILPMSIFTPSLEIFIAFTYFWASPCQINDKNDNRRIKIRPGVVLHLS